MSESSLQSQKLSLRFPAHISNTNWPYSQQLAFFITAIRLWVAFHLLVEGTATLRGLVERSETHRHRYRRKQTDTNTDKHRHRQTQTDTDTDRHRQTQTHINGFTKLKLGL
jgi:hypothetical protein